MKIILNVEYDLDFDLFGIIYPLKEHTLAWEIEAKFDFQFKTKEEFPMKFLKGDLIFSRYSYEENFGYLKIIKNKSWENENNSPYLIPEMKQFDYLLLLDGEIKDLTESDIVNGLKSISNMQYLQKIDIDILKSKQNLIFD